MSPPARSRVIAAFLSIYIIWGSTYLAIRFAIETIPPFLMAGFRFLIAGVMLFAWARLRDAQPLTLRHWWSATIIGAALLLGGNGGVTWAAQHVASGLVALLISMVPLFVVLMDWVRPGGRRPTLAVLAGVVFGLVGLGLLIGPRELLAGGRPDLAGTIVVLLACATWSAGSLYTRHAELPRSPFLAFAMEMLCGGALLLLLGLVTGEGGRLDLGSVSMKSWLSFAYLVVFGALVGFTAYLWLLRVTKPAKVATYAFVNPVIAVLLGAWFAGEPLTPRILVAAAIIVAAVAIITLAPSDAEPVTS